MRVDGSMHIELLVVNCFLIMQSPDDLVIPSFGSYSMEFSTLADELKKIQRYAWFPQDKDYDARSFGYLRNFLLSGDSFVSSRLGQFDNEIRFRCGTETAEGSKLSRSEKKSRKAMEKLGMEPLTGVSRVAMIQRTENVLFSISKPDVFRSPNSENYIIFGEAKKENLSSQPHTQLGQPVTLPDIESLIAKHGGSAEEVEEEEETDIDQSDIDIVMYQAKVSRSKAVEAIRNNDGDIVDAIMELTA